MKAATKHLLGVAPFAIVFAGLASSAIAQDNARYQMEKTMDGYVRLDRQTGEMSICKDQGGQLVCRAAADDRQALSDQVMQMESRIAKLESRLATAEKSGLSGNSDLPTEEEFEKTMGYMEKFFRRFMGVVKDLNEEPQPNKT